jgi:transposase
MPSWWCWGTLGSSGFGSTSARTCGPCSWVLEEAFRYFGGVPKELLFDQRKSVITKDLRLPGGAVMRNAEFLRFGAHLGLHPPSLPTLSDPD